jgi:hypothetical protein
VVMVVVVVVVVWSSNSKRRIRIFVGCISNKSIDLMKYTTTVAKGIAGKQYKAICDKQSVNKHYGRERTKTKINL